MLMPVITEGTMAVYPQTPTPTQPNYQYAQYGASPYDYNYGLGNAAIPQGYATNYNYGYTPYGY